MGPLAELPPSHSPADTRDPPISAWHHAWPAALGVLVAAGTAYELTDVRNAAPVVAASGFVYLAAAASGKRVAAWIAFAFALLLITLEKFTGLDSLPWLLGLAAGAFLLGLARRRATPWLSFPLQAIAMAVLALSAYVATELSPMAGGLLISAALLAHAVWDIHHHRTNRVVDRSLAQFCAVLDVLVAVLIVVLTLAS